MKKMIALLLAVMMIAALTAGCGNTAAEPAAPAADATPAADAAPVEPVTFKLAHDETPESAVGQACTYFAERVAELSNGAMIIDVSDSGTLGSVDEIFESLQVGNIAFAPLSTGALSTTVPDFGVFNMSYTFQNMDQLHEMFDGALGDYLIQLAYDEAQIHIFRDSWSDGQRCYFNNKREVTTAEDMKGLLIRVADRETYKLPLEAMGAVPQVMSISEAYLACSQGTVDGVEMAAAPAIQNNIPDVCKYMTVDGHMVTPKMFAANIAIYEGLTDEQKAVIDQAAHDTALYQREISATIEADAFVALEEAGMVITYCDNTTFKEATATAVPKLAALMSEEVLTLAGLA